MKEVFQNKSKGFRALLGCMALSLITAIVYAATYANTRYFSSTGLGILIAGVVLALVLVMLKVQRFAPAVMLVTSFVALLFHVNNIYFFISSVMTGIQYSGFPPEFFVNFALFGLTLVLSIVCVFLPVEEE